MNFALLEQKSPTATWGEVRSQQKQNQKKSRIYSVAKRKKSTPSNFMIWESLKTLMSLSVKVIFIAICTYWVYAGFQFLTRSSYFAVSEIRFSGNQKLLEEQLLEAAGPLAGENIFLLDLSAVSGNLAAHPWISSVSVKREFPKRILIDLEERVPFARIQLDKIYVMDNFGVLVSKDDTDYQDLPLITWPSQNSHALGENTGTEGIIKGLKTLHYFNRLPFFKDHPIYTLKVGGESRIAFLTLNGGAKVFMTPDTVTESFKKLRIVLDTLESHAGDIDYIDLSFKNQVVLKHKHRKQPYQGT